MGRRCCIAGCTSTSRLPEHHGVTYHSFPADQNSRSIWIRNTKINTDRQLTKSVLVCSRHFRRADFQPQRSGKYLLKQKVFPTVFPWGKVDAAQIEEDLEFLNSTSATPPSNLLTTSSAVDEDTKATVAATVAQIMAQTAELNAAAGIKVEKFDASFDESLNDSATANTSTPPNVKFEPVTSFNPGARLEAQDFDGVWHAARIVEVDNDDREVLIKFEKNAKNKSNIAGTEEWIPMNSSRLRQRISTKPILNFELEEKCLARWSGPRKFPGTVKKILPNDVYEILFDDGYVKNVRAIHMNKVQPAVYMEPEIIESPAVVAEGTTVMPITPPNNDTSLVTLPVTPSSSALKRPSSGQNSGSQSKKRVPSGPRKDWPLLDLSKLDLSSLNLPEIPKDGEWTCHWVNDQPIGREGYLVVGEHRKPTVIVEDWRLPPGWVKHMYQRSNVLGKWDVILVTPNGKRFRSKADLKTYLEELGQVYNPDIFDFSIHRRRAKDINCYVYTPDYVPPQPVKAKSSLNSSLDSSLENKTSPIVGALSTSVSSPYMDTPVAEPLPPIELLTSSSSLAAEDKSVTQVEAEVPKQLLEASSLNLPEIPKDGEWTCHWVNDQPIGREGYLVVGEHRKPTVIVEDWRLPPGWVKHMYQRSNVLGKWDVILVTPNGKRFRSKADLKTYLEELGQVYNPDIFDFSIHRRRAKDINCYVYTPDYVPPQPVKAKSSLNSSLDSSLENKTSPIVGALSTSVSSPYMDTPVAEPLPPIELLTSSSSLAAEDKSVTQVEAEVPKQLLEAAEVSSTPTPTSTPTVGLKEEAVLSSDCGTPTPLTASLTQAPTLEARKVEDGYALIGGLKVQIIDNLFRCPQEGCSKNFRKENHLQIHVKHYHRNLVKLLGSCPKMLELAEKRTHPIDNDVAEPVPKNQIPNQQFFAKLHQQDLEHTRAHRRSTGLLKSTVEASAAEVKTERDEDASIKVDGNSQNMESTQNDMSFNNTTANSSALMESSFASTSAADDSLATELTEPPPNKRSRFSPNKRASGSRKSNRQRTTRKYLTAAQATAGLVTSATSLSAAGETTFSGVADFEETRHSFNATPDINKDVKKRKTVLPPNTPLSSVDSPITADSGSNSFQPQNSTEYDTINQPPQYIKENGELIKIVHMRQEEIINCLCGYCEEDGLMIQCELCLCWQHGLCNGIDKVSQVPDKYVCFICRNPQRVRESLRFKHDQDWLYEGKLPVANYHTSNPSQLNKRSEYLKKSHILTGNLLELKNYMHSLKVKINIANNKCHPKLYLWAKKWDEDIVTEIKSEIKPETGEEGKTGNSNLPVTPTKKIKSEPTTPARLVPNIPQPEAPIDPVECQQRLMEHIKIQQDLVMSRLDNIEKAIDVLESEDDLPDLRENDFGATKDVLAAFIKELDTVKQIAKLNGLEHTKLALKNPIPAIK